MPVNMRPATLSCSPHSLQRLPVSSVFRLPLLRKADTLPSSSSSYLSLSCHFSAPSLLFCSTLLLFTLLLLLLMCCAVILLPLVIQPDIVSVQPPSSWATWASFHVSHLHPFLHAEKGASAQLVTLWVLSFFHPIYFSSQNSPLPPNSLFI